MIITGSGKSTTKVARSTTPAGSLLLAYVGRKHLVMVLFGVVFVLLCRIDHFEKPNFTHSLTHSLTHLC